MNTVSKFPTWLYTHVLVAEGYTKVFMRWKHKQLIDENKRTQVDTAQKFLAQHRCDPTINLCIITCDKLCILYITSTHKEDPWVRHRKGELASKKFHLDCFTKKILCTLFWGCWTILSVNFQEGQNKRRMNSKKYMGNSQKKFKIDCLKILK